MSWDPNAGHDGLSFTFESIGAPKLIDDIKRVEDSAKKTTHSFAETADRIGNSAKKIARDFDVMGDETAQNALKAVDAVGGLTAAIGSGGLLAVVGAVAVGFAAYNSIVGRAAEQTKIAQEAVKKYTEESRALAEQIIKTNDASSKELDAQRRVAIEVIRLNGLKVSALLTAYRLQQAIAEEQSAKAKTLFGDAGGAATLAAAVARDQMQVIGKELLEFQRTTAELGVQVATLSEKEKVAKTREAAEERKKIVQGLHDAEAKANQAAVDKMIQADADETVRRAKAQADMDAAADARARSRAGTGGQGNFDADRAAYLQGLQWQMDMETLAADKTISANNRILQSEFSTNKQRIAAINELAKAEAAEIQRRSAMTQVEINLKYQFGEISKTERDGLLEQDTLMTDALIQNRMRERDATIAALEEQTQARNNNMAATIAAGQIELAHEATLMVVQPVVQEFTGSLRELGDVNRENYQDFVLFSDELPAIIAKKSQAILAGIAAEAAGKAILSMGESAYMFATGLSYLAIPGMQGQAMPAFASAGKYAMAAAVYGGIAGVSVGGAVAIGAMRGEGGLVPLTRAEKEEMQRREGKKDKGSEHLGGDSGNMGDTGERVLNILIQNNAPVFGGDDTAAEMMAASLARAQRGYFGAATTRGV